MPTIINGATGCNKFTTSSVSTGAIADDAVTAVKIAANAVTSSELAAASVGTLAIIDANVTTAKILDANVTPAKLSQPLTLTATQALTSGTYKDFLSIPSWVRRITVMFQGLSTNGTSYPIVQIGDSGGVETSTYGGTTCSVVNAAATGAINWSTGAQIISAAATAYLHGCMVLTLTDPATNLWVITVSAANSASGIVFHGAGYKTLSATLNQVRLTTVNGTDAFDTGIVTILYEG